MARACSRTRTGSREARPGVADHAQGDERSEALHVSDRLVKKQDEARGKTASPCPPWRRYLSNQERDDEKRRQAGTTEGAACAQI